MDQTAAREIMTRFWTDWFDMLGSASPRPPAGTTGRDRAAAGADGEGDGAGGGWPSMSPQAVRQFQNAFLESLAHACDEYLRSPQFLSMMKQAMDNALTFRQQVNDFLARTATAGFQQSAGYPPDQTVIVDAIRETERKLRDRIDLLSQRIAAMEARMSPHPASREEAAAAPSPEERGD